MALKHLNKTQTGDLVVYDRGYPTVWFYKYHMLKNVDFCMRIVQSSNVVKAFLESGKYSDVVNFPCVEKSLRRCRKDNISTQSLNLRLVRVDLPSGEAEVLVSFLTDQQVYPASIFADLYHQRWGVDIFQSCCLHKPQVILSVIPLSLPESGISTALAAPLFQVAA